MIVRLPRAVGGPVSVRRLAKRGPTYYDVLIDFHHTGHASGTFSARLLDRLDCSMLATHYGVGAEGIMTAYAAVTTQSWEAISNRYGSGGIRYHHTQTALEQCARYERDPCDEVAVLG